MINATKQANEFGLTQAGQTVVSLLTFISDIHSVGLKTVDYSLGHSLEADVPRAQSSPAEEKCWGARAIPSTLRISVRICCRRERGRTGNRLRRPIDKRPRYVVQRVVEHFRPWVTSCA
jgi:hypothetical protein